MSKPRKNPKKNLKKFSANAIFKKNVFQASFQTNESFFSMTLMEFFGTYEQINTLNALLSDFGDFDFGPETEFSTLAN